MGNNIKEVWENALASLKGSLGNSDAFKNIQTITPLSIGDASVTLGVSDEFFKGFFLDQYLGDIQQAIANSNDNRDLPLMFAFGPEYVREITEQENTDSSIIIHSSPGIILPGSILPSKYTFDSFFVGENNRLAYNVSKNIADKLNDPSEKSPLILYGETGLGKSHLMYAIGNQVLKSGKGNIVACLPAENFLNEYIDSLKKFSSDAFRKKYRGVDLFLLDDLHFFTGKEKIQEEFFNTFNALSNSGKQIVMTSNYLPKECKFDDALTSRLEESVISTISGTDFSSRREFLRSLLPSEADSFVVDYLAKNITSNYRKLRGAASTVGVYEFSFGKVKTEEELHGVVRHLLESPRRPDISEVLKVVCKEYDLSPSDLVSEGRGKLEITTPRHIAMYLLREAGYTFPEIGKGMNRNHASVMNACQNISNGMKTDENLYQCVTGLARRSRIKLSKD